MRPFLSVICPAVHEARFEKGNTRHYIYDCRYIYDLIDIILKEKRDRDTAKHIAEQKRTRQHAQDT